MKEQIYIHYGSTNFDASRFNPIKNEPYFNKPTGGLWASPIDTECGWKDWCDKEEFIKYKEDNCFRFILPEANIAHIRSVEDIDKLPQFFGLLSSRYIDFEKCLKLGYDAVELHLSDNYDLYMALYGWDCDSIIVLNPEKIKVVR